MILKKTEMEEMPKRVSECSFALYCPNILQCNPPKRAVNCPLINPKNIRYEAERVDNGEIVKGQLIQGVQSYIITDNNVRYAVVSLDGIGVIQLVEIKPETLKIVLEGGE